jgi:putative ABC transport system ATP-binding protein
VSGAGSPAGDAVVRLERVTKAYRRGAETVVAVASATVAVEPGSLTVVTGPSGSGKTTLLNLVLGWEQPDSGRRHPATSPDDWTALAVVPQRLGLIEQCTIGENVALPGRVRPLADDPTRLMAELGIDHLADRFPFEISLGEQQRTAVARALVGGPRLLVVDEPTSHQDDRNTHRISELLRAAAGSGSAVLVATHDPRVARHGTVHHRIVDGHLTVEATQ